MEAKDPLFFTFFILTINIIFLNNEVLSAQASNHTKSIPLQRSSFPPNFLFGAGSASYQFEGAVKEDGRGPSIWDTYTHLVPSKIADGSNGDVADDFYHRYKEDVNLIKFLGLNAFRISISWSRVLPHGKLSKGVNKAGIAFYNDLINTLLSKGITPFATIFHWDTPQDLEDEYLSFLSPNFVDDYRDFADLCFKEFGDRVKHWSTFNEPWTFLTTGYDATILAGQMAPGRCSKWVNKGCPAGDSSTEPYLAGHHLLLSHAAASKLYRQKYKPHQKGEIGIVLVSNWFVPFANKKANIEAAQRALDFFYGWFLDPLTYGDYPKAMRSTVGKRLPYFTPEQSEALKGSLDFLGVNYYSPAYASPLPPTNSVNISYSTDIAVALSGVRNGKPIGALEGMGGFFDYPEGLKELLVYTKDKYKNPLIYITENGYGSLKKKTVAENTNDPGRITFYKGHLKSLLAALKEGVNVKGFFAWSLLDTFEWNSGYTVGFGLTYVDFNNEQKRYPKKSAFWFKKFLSK